MGMDPQVLRRVADAIVLHVPSKGQHISHVPLGPSPHRSLTAAVICEQHGGGDARIWAVQSVGTPLAAAWPSGDAFFCRMIARDRPIEVRLVSVADTKRLVVTVYAFALEVKREVKSRCIL